jgi:hypothetical protein
MVRPKHRFGPIRLIFGIVLFAIKAQLPTLIAGAPQAAVALPGIIGHDDRISIHSPRCSIRPLPLRTDKSPVGIQAHVQGKGDWML